MEDLLNMFKVVRVYLAFLKHIYKYPKKNIITIYVSFLVVNNKTPAYSSHEDHVIF